MFWSYKKYSHMPTFARSKSERHFQYRKHGNRKIRKYFHCSFCEKTFLYENNLASHFIEHEQNKRIIVKQANQSDELNVREGEGIQNEDQGDHIAPHTYPNHGKTVLQKHHMNT